MANMVEIVVGAVGGIITIYIFLEVFKTFTWNSAQTNISSSAISLLSIVDLVLAASIIIMIMVFAFSRR